MESPSDLLDVNRDQFDDPMLARKEVQKIRRSSIQGPSSSSRRSKKRSNFSQKNDSEQSTSTGDSFEVEKILDKKLEGFEKYYLVLWKGWPESAADWVPYHNMACDDLIAEYEKEERTKRHLKRTRDWETPFGSDSSSGKAGTSKEKTVKVFVADTEQSEDETDKTSNFQNELRVSSDDEDGQEETSEPIEEQQVNCFKEFFVTSLTDLPAESALIQFQDIIESPDFGNLMDDSEWEFFEKSVDSKNAIKFEDEKFYRNLYPLKIIGYFCDQEKNPYVQMEWADGMQMYVSFVAALKNFPKIFLPWLENYLSETKSEEEFSKNESVVVTDLKGEAIAAKESISTSVETEEATNLITASQTVLVESFPKSLEQTELKEEAAFATDPATPDSAENLAGKVFRMSLGLEPSTSPSPERKLNKSKTESQNLPSTSSNSASLPNNASKINTKIKTGLKVGKSSDSKRPNSRTGRPPKQAKPVVQNRPATRILPKPQLEKNEIFPVHVTSQPVTFGEHLIVSTPSLGAAEPVVVGVVEAPIRGNALYDSKMEELKRYAPMLQDTLDKLTKENPLRKDPLHRVSLLRNVATHSNVQYDTLSKCVEVIRRSRNWFIAELGPSVIPVFAQSLLQTPQSSSPVPVASLPSSNISTQANKNSQFPQNSSSCNVSQTKEILKKPSKNSEFSGLNATTSSSSSHSTQFVPSSSHSTQIVPSSSHSTQIVRSSSNSTSSSSSPHSTQIVRSLSHHTFNRSTGQRFVDPRVLGNGFRFPSANGSPVHRPVRPQMNPP